MNQLSPSEFREKPSENEDLSRLQYWMFAKKVLPQLEKEKKLLEGDFYAKNEGALFANYEEYLKEPDSFNQKMPFEEFVKQEQDLSNQYREQLDSSQVMLRNKLLPQSQ